MDLRNRYVGVFVGRPQSGNLAEHIRDVQSAVRYPSDPVHGIGKGDLEKEVVVAVGEDGGLDGASYFPVRVCRCLVILALLLLQLETGGKGGFLERLEVDRGEYRPRLVLETGRFQDGASKPVGAGALVRHDTVLRLLRLWIR